MAVGLGHDFFIDTSFAADGSLGGGHSAAGLVEELID